MQQVKLKSGSMAEARYGNDDEYYLQSIENSGRTLLTVIRDGKLFPLCVDVIELEAVKQDVMLPISDNEILATTKDKGFVFNGVQITEDGYITYYRIDEGALIELVKGLL